MKTLTKARQVNLNKFYFACLGYLDSIAVKQDQFIARICRVQPLENSNRDEVIWFNCIVKDSDNKLLLNDLYQKVKEGKNVEVSFLGVYAGAEEFQCCLTEEDPEHMLTLKAELSTISSYLIDGSDAINND